MGSATTDRRRSDKARPSQPQDKTVLGRTVRPSAIARSQAHRSSRNVFDRLGRSRGEDMRTHLEVSHTSTTSIMRQEEAVISSFNDKINELRARLEKLAARNTEAVQSISTSPFSVEIQQTPLPVGFRMPTMSMYEGKTDPLDYLDAFNDKMDLLQVTTLTRCRCFVVTLSGTAKKWIRQIEPKTIVSWGKSSATFMCQFQEPVSTRLL